MRGKVPAAPSAPMISGITPAYAGKRQERLSSRTSRRDHPRVCGEKLSCPVRGRHHKGSPPRMRGKVSLEDVLYCNCGITPAYAGKSHSKSAIHLPSWDHPRVCGEKQFQLFDNTLRQGSPPRMRGKVMVKFQPLPVVGITPAYAGKRLKRSHSIGHFSCILCLFHSVLHRASASGGSRAGPCAPPCLPAQNAVPV